MRTRCVAASVGTVGTVGTVSIGTVSIECARLVLVEDLGPSSDKSVRWPSTTTTVERYVRGTI
jgi:hypothetical protein